MGKITIQEYTTKFPIQMIGYEAGICWGADVSDKDKNYKRGLDCLESMHGRTEEFPDVYMTVDKYSAKVIRELYTHIGGLPTRLQASTRYIDYGEFDYIIPKSISNNKEALDEYLKVMNFIAEGYNKLQTIGIPKEDISMLLPFGMETKIVEKMNLRNMIEMSHLRMCNRAFWEFRELMDCLCSELSNYSEEWKYLVDNYFMPRCKFLGSCPEKHPCYERKNS